MNPEKKIRIWFDMDGTIYDLYKIENWLERLRARDATVYNEQNRVRRSIGKIRAAIIELERYGVEFGVISWLAMGADCSYQMQIIDQKFKWTWNNIPELLSYGAFYCVPYGAHKGRIAQAHDPEAYHILIDDNKEVRAEWRKLGPQYQTIDASRGFITKMVNITLAKILEET